jgi:hypothetical protein
LSGSVVTSAPSTTAVSSSETTSAGIRRSARFIANDSGFGS